MATPLLMVRAGSTRRVLPDSTSALGSAKMWILSANSSTLSRETASIAAQIQPITYLTEHVFPFLFNVDRDSGRTIAHASIFLIYAPPLTQAAVDVFPVSVRINNWLLRATVWLLWLSAPKDSTPKEGHASQSRTNAVTLTLYFKGASPALGDTSQTEACAKGWGVLRDKRPQALVLSVSMCLPSVATLTP